MLLAVISLPFTDSLAITSSPTLTWLMFFTFPVNVVELVTAAVIDPPWPRGPETDSVMDVLLTAVTLPAMRATCVPLPPPALPRDIPPPPGPGDAGEAAAGLEPEDGDDDKSVTPSATAAPIAAAATATAATTNGREDRGPRPDPPRPNLRCRGEFGPAFDAYGHSSPDGQSVSGTLGSSGLLEPEVDRRDIDLSLAVVVSRVS
jgi:hypothetical protein